MTRPPLPRPPAGDQNSPPEDAIPLADQPVDGSLTEVPGKDDPPNANTDADIEDRLAMRHRRIG